MIHQFMKLVLLAMLSLSCWIILSSLGPKAADAANGRIAVKVDGPRADAIRAQLVSALPSGTEAVDAPRLADELTQQGLDDLAGAVSGGKKRPVLIKKLRRVARAAEVDALMVGVVAAGEKKGPGELQLLVILTAQSDAAVDETLTLNKKGGAPARQLKNLLETALEGLSGEAAGGDEKASPNEASGADRPTDAAKASGEAEPDAGGPVTVTVTDALFVGFVGFDLNSRQFHYNQRITNASLRPYDLPSGALLPVAPGAVVALELYPFARGDSGFVRDLGVTSTLDYNYAKAQTGTTTLSTNWFAWEANLRARFHLGPRGASPVVGLEAGGGQLLFAFKGSGVITNTLPSVNYTYARFGADGRVPLGQLSVMAGAAYHYVFSCGQLTDHFPRASIGGLDAHVGAALALTSNVEARLGVTYLRYWSAFNSRAGDTYIAGGALDNMLAVDLGIAAFF